eukprot:3098153-Amphidinium_carterae.1
MSADTQGQPPRFDHWSCVCACVNFATAPKGIDEHAMTYKGVEGCILWFARATVQETNMLLMAWPCEGAADD